MKPNDKTAAICGLFCGSCSFYPKACLGCLSEKLVAHCVSCPNGFRKCAQSHDVLRCYECEEFPCSRLNKFKKQHFVNGIGHHTKVIENLKFMKDFGVQKFVEKETTENTCSKCGKIIFWFDKNNHKCEE